MAPDEKPVNVNVGVSTDRAARNAEAFDRVWTRMDRTYFAVQVSKLAVGINGMH